MMTALPKYHFFKYKYGDELLIDVVALRDIKKYLSDNSHHLLTYYDITLITEGAGLFNIDDNIYSVKKGDVLFTLPNQCREWDIKNIINGYALIFEEEFLLSFFNDTNFLNNISYLNKTKRRSGKLILSDDEFLQVCSLIQKINTEIHDYTTKDKHILRAILYQILKILDRIYLNQYDVSQHIAKNRHIHKFLELVNLKYQGSHSVQYYANELCLTPNYLNELVKKETGYTAKHIIQDKLLHEVKRLLHYTDFSVTEIADRLHFENPSYLIRIFRKHTGLTPLQFRNKEKP